MSDAMNTIQHYDCLAGMEELPDACADLLILDPPYFNIHGDFDFDFESREQYIAWMQRVLRECHRVAASSASLYLWGAIGVNTGWQLFELTKWIENNELFRVINWVTQRNSRGFGTKRGYMMAREEVVFMVKGKDYTWNGAYTADRSTRSDLGANGKPRTNEFKRCSDVWVDIPEASQSSKQRFKLSDGTTFPTVKAERLCERIITASSNPGDVVLVPFAGSGSECVVAQRLGRRFIGFERDRRHYDLAMSRLTEGAPTDAEKADSSRPIRPNPDTA